ncbi:MAG: hypothetical protein WBD74_02430 [Candidatus Aquilonibacter sp.]
MRNRLLFTLIILVAAPALSIAAQRDAATIANSGSTNTVGFIITLWSDGTGSATMQGGTARAIAITPDLTTRFFTDLHAAHLETTPPQHCMKSASFGTATTVTWHAWRSPDLQCPSFSADLGALAKDVQAIEAAAGVMPGTLRRIGLPPSLRKNPPATPEAQPT